MASDNKLENDYLLVKSSIPGLQNKIHIGNLEPGEKIYWYIKFNLRLNPDTVSSETMNVTDGEGYILETKISYRPGKNLISISPLEDYVENEYYILNISKEVRSEKNNPLKNDIHILFKIKGRRVADFIILPPTAIVPAPKIRVRHEEPKPAEPSNSRVYSFDNYITKGDELPLADIRLNPLVGIVGALLTLGSLFLGNMIIMIVCGIIALLGIFHIVFQLINKKNRSNFAYNKGVRCFRKDNFTSAEKYFNKAVTLNPNNEYAEYAKSKMTYYKQ